MMTIQQIIESLEEDFLIAKNKVSKAEQKLEELKTMLKEVQPEQNQYLNVNQVSELTKMSVFTIRNMTCQKRIPFIKKGRKVLYPLKDINMWLLNDKYNDVSCMV